MFSQVRHGYFTQLLSACVYAAQWLLKMSVYSFSMCYIASKLHKYITLVSLCSFIFPIISLSSAQMGFVA